MSYIGVDIIEISRIKRTIERRGQEFLRRIYTESEIERYRDKIPSLAARFAGKEAVMKALRAPGRGVRYRDIEILADSDGQPLVNLHGKARKQAESLGISRLSISLSHSKELAVALVSGEIEKGSG